MQASVQMNPFLKSRSHALSSVTPLVVEIRSKISKKAAHPSSIGVHVHEGTVTLSGPLFDHEVECILDAVREIDGVSEVHQQFDIMTSSARPQMQHQQKDHFGYQPEFIVGRWAPWLRIVLGSAGLLFLSQAIRKQSKFRGFSAFMGTAFLSRSITNRDLTQVIGSFILPVVSMRRTLTIDAPVDDVFEFWKDFENYPKFMSFIRAVKVNESGGLIWTSDAPGRTQLTWDTTLFDLRPNQRIAWKSVRGSVIATEGIIQMEPQEKGRTLLHVELSYAPPFGALGYAAAHFLGFDPRSRIDEDLEVMKAIIENQGRLPKQNQLIS